MNFELDEYLQFAGFVFEAIGLPLALLGIHNRTLAERIEKFLRTPSFHRVDEHPMTPVGAMLVAIYLWGSAKEDWQLVAGPILFVVASIIAFRSEVGVALTDIFGNGNHIAGLGLILAFFGLFCETFQVGMILFG